MSRLSLLITASLAMLFFGCGEETNFKSNAPGPKPVEEGQPAAEKPGASAPTGGDAKAETPTTQEVVGGNTEIEFPEALTAEFTSGTFVDGRVALDIEARALTQDYVLERAKSVEKLERNYTQVQRPPVMETFAQGTSGDDITENFDQASYGVLDILVVVDNSGSMNQEQQNLSTKLESLLTYVKDSDWQIGVVTTDQRDLVDPCLRGLIKKGDANATTAFASAIQAGTSGSGNEIGILTSTMAIQCPTQWMRDKSSLAVLIISDEDNCSNGNCGGAAYQDPKYLLDEIAKTRTVGDHARVYGLIHIPGTQCNTAYNVSNVYNTLITDSKGVAGSICDADYSNTLMQISQDVAAILEFKFKLKATPDAGSVKVYVDNNLLASGYTVNGDEVVFATPPAEGAKIRIDYVVGATPKYKTFDLAEAPYMGSVTAMINGVDVSAFAVDYANNKVTFDAEPEDLAEIRIGYRRNIDLPKTFDIGKKAISTTVKAFVDNNEVGVTSYDQGTGILTLDNFPEENKMLKVTFDVPKVGAPIIEFAFKTPWGTVEALKAFDTDSKEEITVTYANEKIKFDPASFTEGRKVTVQYKDQSFMENALTLTVDPVKDSIQVMGFDEDGNEIKCDANEIEVKDSMIITKCDLVNAVKLEAKYKFAVNLQDRFEVAGIENPDAANWKVFVNDKEDKTHKREGSTIIFPEALAAGTSVKVVVGFSNDKK